MLLQINSNAASRNERKSRSTMGGHYFLGKKMFKNKSIFLNGAVHTLCKVIGVATSATKAKLGSLFLNAQEAVKLWIELDKMGHPQLPTPIHEDNMTAASVFHGTIKR